MKLNDYINQIEGNVALDVARIFLKGEKHLIETDITDQCINILRDDHFDEVHIFGRRGPAQASFTNKELREMFEIENCDVYIAKEDLDEINDASKEEIKNSRTHKRMLDLMSKKAKLISKEEMIKSITNSEMNSNNNQKKCFIHFQMSPVEYLKSDSDESYVGSIVFESTTLSGETGKQKAKGKGDRIQLNNCGLVLESVGYNIIPIDGIPVINNAIQHNEGRILNANGEHLEGLYASGWFKRGPQGVIATNVWDAQETERSLISDFISGKIPMDNRRPMYRGIQELLEENQLFHLVSTWQDWKQIEQAEELRSKNQNSKKPREKFLSATEMNLVKRKE